MARYIYLAQVSIPAKYEALFEDLYDNEHVPDLLTVPGVKSCTRYKLEWADSPEVAQYLAIYEVDNPDVPKTDAWKEASDKGDWSVKIRPHFSVRLHSMYKALDREI